MLHLRLYNYSDAIKRVNKSSVLPVVYTSLTGDQVEEVQNLSDVEIIIASSTAPTFNYAYIQEYNRYYFITNITWIGGTAFQLSLHVDVLFTYYSKFTTMNALIAYSTSGSALEFDPRLNYVDQPVVTRSFTYRYPACILDNTQANPYTSDPWVMIRYYQLQSTGTYNTNAIETAFMNFKAYKYFLADYLSGVRPEMELVDFGSRIIDITNVYYINESRLQGASTVAQGITIRTPKYPNGITVYSLDPDDPDTLTYLITTPAQVGAMGYAIVQGGTVAAATHWDLNGQYITKIPYVGEFSFTPAKAGIKTAISMYYAIAIDPFNVQYVVTPIDSAIGAGNWYWENTQHVNIKTSNAFPVDTSFDNAVLRKTQLAIDGTVEAIRGISGGSGMLPIFSNILGTVGQMQSVDAAEATHYKYTGEFSGAAEWTPADTNYLVNTSVIVPPDTNSAAYWSAYGKPDHEMRYLYDLTGYAQIEQIHMRYMDTATKSEIDELETLLKSGVIF